MAEFLVRIALERPDGIEDETWTDLLAKEAEVGADYRRRGVIVRIWRIPGTTSNVGLWSADDASELHDRLAGLPAYRYMRIQVEVLARHYLEAGSY